MALNKVIYVDGVTVITAENLNDIQDAIIALETSPSQGLSEDVKQALLQLAQKVAYIDDRGQTYYDDLYNALYPPRSLDSIDAVFNQGSAVIYDTASLNSLKQYLTVTANYSDGTREMLSDSAYTLSGTLTVGTSTVTASYQGKTDTFAVTVTEAPVLDSISAVYTQSGTVYDSDTLDSLKDDLVVTAHYADSSTQTVPAADYTLSGTLTVGTSTITVSYGGKTTTFSVTVSESSDTSPIITEYDVSFNGDGTTSTRNDWAITDFYSTNYPGSLPYTLVVDFGGYNSSANLITYDENKVKTNEYMCNTRERELVWRTVAPPAFFRTSVYYIREAAYAYVKETGVVIFADVNSPYYGMQNISEASS